MMTDSFRWPESLKLIERHLDDCRKSSASGHSSDCVELASYQDRIAVRDSKSPHGPAITALLTSLKSDTC